MTDSLLRNCWPESRREINGLSLHVVETGDPGDLLLMLLHSFPEFW